MPQLKTMIWFLKRPKYYRQVFQILKRSKNAEKENTREDATAWCQENCVPQDEALRILTGKTTMPVLRELFPEIMNTADELAEKTPVKMGGEGAVSLIYHLVSDANPGKSLETGVAYGWSSLAMLLAIKEIEGARLISNDMPYVNEQNEDFVGVVIPDALKDKWELQRMADITGIRQALKKFYGKLDFIHYVSDKSYTGRTWPTPILWKALNPGSFMMTDGINDNIAFKEFCTSIQQKPVIIEHGGKYVGILRKG